MRRGRLFATALLIVLAACEAAAPAGAPPSRSAPLPLAPVSSPANPAGPVVSPAATSRPVRWIAVSVATLWTQPGIARAIDAPALQNPARPREWIASMTVAQERWLVGRIETQALYGTKVYVLGTSGSWTKIAVEGQPTPRNTLGYPGWVPARQLTPAAPAGATRFALVRAKTTWVWRNAAAIGTPSGKVMEISYDTRLPVSSFNSTSVNVVMLGGVHRAVQRNAVTLRATGDPWVSSRAQVISEGRKFLGVPYLWGGTSAFAFDCSGYTHEVLAALGVTIARDADEQARHGISETAANRAPGDLVFFKDSSGHVVHVGIYYGLDNGVRSVMHAPSTGSSVRITPLSWWPASHYAGARRYVRG